MREAKLQNLILAQLGELAPDVFVWRANRGAVKRGASFIRFGARGQADILGLVRGRFLAVEVKGDQGMQQLEQYEFQGHVEAAGGTYIVARELNDVLIPVRRMLAVPMTPIDVTRAFKELDLELARLGTGPLVLSGCHLGLGAVMLRDLGYSDERIRDTLMTALANAAPRVVS